MGVLGEKERAGDAGGGAVFADGLGDGEDVGVVEAVVERAAAVSAGAESDALRGDGGVGVVGVEGGDEAGDVGEGFREGRLAWGVGDGGGHGERICEGSRM